MTTASPHRRDRRSTGRRSTDRGSRRPLPTPPPSGTGPSASGPAPAPCAPPTAACCTVSTTERRSLGGTVIRTHRHHPRCPVWAAR
ncbi:hypothetical protein [Kitasatospora purpeofusca]|uniref:hypothetical protein n=1 Tax=Kitasatospora purpeofusca TaxID=67352 RepID=UPI002A5AA551|nr:hypothetical protein [Kitasatospora purpeofusca]MDY0815625.1 hypothetical protein [Kitasatospora purpeofusca]